MFQTERGLVFVGEDHARPRMVVEREKLANRFPGFTLDEVNRAVTGYIHTSYDRCYWIRIDLPDRYPYTMPVAWVPREDFSTSCPHRYISGNLCVMNADQWSSTLSLAFFVAKVALWMNKYDSWRESSLIPFFRTWPGNQQSH
jgi:ubiquitin-protein ligase